jgi:probable F420-dependent oxidoreductase
LGLQSHARLHADDGRDLVALGHLAEESGFDGVLIGDHVVIGPALDQYPYPPVHFAADDPWLEPLTVLAAVAVLTTRITLATGVLVSPLRPAVLLAKTAATVDAISAGRLELGVGVGWQPEEFAAVGADFAQRGELMTDGIRACQALWRDQPASHSGSTVEFENLWCSPPPVRSDGIPILFAGSLHRRNLTRICELGTGWITHPRIPLPEIEEGIIVLRKAFADAGRDPATLRVRSRVPITLTESGAVDVAVTMRSVEDYVATGVTDLTVWTTNLTNGQSPLREAIRMLGSEWDSWWKRREQVEA